MTFNVWTYSHFFKNIWKMKTVNTLYSHLPFFWYCKKICFAKASWWISLWISREVSTQWKQSIHCIIILPQKDVLLKHFCDFLYEFWGRIQLPLFRVLLLFIQKRFHLAKYFALVFKISFSTFSKLQNSLVLRNHKSFDFCELLFKDKKKSFAFLWIVWCVFFFLDPHTPYAKDKSCT